MSTTGAASPTGATGRFSEEIRTATWPDHGEAETAGFVSDLVAGTLPRQAYAALAAQHHAIYGALEAAAVAMADDVVAGPFVDPALTRTPALVSDLTALAGAHASTWPPVLPATAAYVERIREVCFAWPGGFVAHHYTRYLGDLSGGLMIGRAVSKAYGDDVAAFYRFDAIDDPRAFKAAYRERLDRAPWDAEERRRVLDEIRLAYRFNTEVFRALDALGAAPTDRG